MIARKEEKTEQIEKDHDEHPSNEHPAKKDDADTTKKKEEHPTKEHPKN